VKTCGPALERIPLSKGGSAEGVGVVWHGLVNLSRQPPGGYATAVAAPPPPLTKGEFAHSSGALGTSIPLPRGRRLYAFSSNTPPWALLRNHKRPNHRRSRSM
jgi:hypothetical protein